MNIMVTGVTGGYGSYAIEYLKEFAPDDEIYAFVPAKKVLMNLEKKVSMHVWVTFPIWIQWLGLLKGLADCCSFQ